MKFIDAVRAFNRTIGLSGILYVAAMPFPVLFGIVLVHAGIKGEIWNSYGANGIGMQIVGIAIGLFLVCGFAAIFREDGSHAISQFKAEKKLLSDARILEQEKIAQADRSAGQLSCTSETEDVVGRLSEACPEGSLMYIEEKRGGDL